MDHWQLAERLAAMLYTTLVALLLPLEIPPPPPEGPEAAGEAPVVAEGEAPRAPAMPSAGFLRDFEQDRIERRAVAAGIAEAPTVPLDRNPRIPVICVRYQDTCHPPFPVESYGTLLFNDPPAPQKPGDPPPSSLTQYYRDMSLGSFQVSGKVFGWLELPGKVADYEEDADGDGKTSNELATLVRDSLAAADPTVDFADFDSNDDGKVDLVILIHPRPSSQSKKGRISNQFISMDDPYFRGLGYAPYATDEERVPGLAPVEVVDVVVVAGVEPPIAEDGTGTLPTLGVFCHEFGHALGLPDLWDRTSQDQLYRGVGYWCLMGWGLNGGDPKGSRPVALSAWCKKHLGWADPVPIDAAQEAPVRIEPVGRNNLIYRFDVPGTGGKEYYLIEHRNPSWTPPAPLRRINWDASLPAQDGGGLAIWHVDETVGDPPLDGFEWPFANLNKGQNDNPWLDDQSAVDSRNHPLVRLVQADGQFGLESNLDFGDPGDLWSLDVEQRFDPKSYRSGPLDHALTMSGGTLQVVAGPPMVAEIDRPPARDGDSAGREGPRDGPPTAAPEAPSEVADETTARRLETRSRPRAGPAREAPASVALSRQGTRSAIGRVAVEERIGVEKADLLRDIDRQVQASGKEVLERPEVRSFLKDLPTGVIASTVNQANRTAIEKAALEARTRPVEVSRTVARPATETVMRLEKRVVDGREVIVQVPATLTRNVYETIPVAPPEDGLGRQVYGWLQETKGGASAIVRSDVGNEHAELISGFSIPREMATVQEDAEQRLDALAPILGHDPATMQPAGVQTSGERFEIVEFQPVLAVGNAGAPLPIFNATTSFYYDKSGGQFSGVTSRQVDQSEIDLGDLTPELPAEEAGRRASALLDPGKTLSGPPRLGIYCVNDDPKQARLAYEAVAPSGAGREPTRIYLDANTGKLLKIE